MGNEMSLHGKVALVTGSSRGIGRAIALKLATEGSDVIINYFRKRSAAELTAQEARDKGVTAHVIKANLGEPEKIDSMFDEIEKRFGRLGILINNAASGVARSALELDTRGWDWTMDVNAIAPGFITTEMTDKLPQETKDTILSRIPLNRFGTPDDVAELVAFLASERASYITAQVICIDGGVI